MADRKEPKPSTLKALFAKSGNQCAFPGCTQAVIDDKCILIAEVCHINAVKKIDARWDKSLDDEALRSYDNLIILCHAHHKRIDTLEDEYPADDLRQMRRNHEDAMAGSNFTASDSAIAESIFELTSEDFAWDLEEVADHFEKLLEEGTIWAQQHMNQMECNVCAVLNAQLHFLHLKALARLPSPEKLAFIVRHEEWKSGRTAYSEKAVESHGGTLAPLEYACAYAEKTRERISHLRNIARRQCS